MPDTTTLTIVFRGLTVFRKNREESQMEIGILTDDGHVPRISTIQNGVLSKVFDLRRIPAFDNKDSFNWRIQIDGLEPNASIYTNGSIGFNRQTHPDDRDFRWIADLESSEFYGRDLTAELDTSLLFPIVQVPYGEFYTRLKTVHLKRTRGTNPTEDFGCLGGVTGCDIELPVDATAKLIAVDDGSEIFRFKNAPNTIYEFANSPPDVDVHMGMVMAGHQPDHFQHYYDLFRDPNVERFVFSEPNPAPSPDPALCGGANLGDRQGPLRP